ncbi:dTDP-4-dehydrorhamnose reductase [Amaricoccus sp.]|uniref:dTDP-4-dehydrorhamnose reductase n=1 Tax=Amaricoccus sp. TaxID=1872485 RepID=UPI001B490C95|nr:dTDP-4-dehydrorhamnose reductase [Amaricoccus sp.]MBP7003005.1 dTDP-4-dehydrorhamnose reductase [Amaricoccus sp.]
MRLLVLGAAGQLGGDLMTAAAAAGVEAAGATRAEVDVADLPRLRAFLEGQDFDALVNCAARLDTEAIEGDPAPALAVNGHAPAVMAEVAAAKGARMIQVSTDYVFGGDTGRATPLTEADPTAPVNVYGLTKAFGETLARLGGGDVSVFRVASTFGVRGAAGKGGNFVETMIRMGTERGALKVVADQVMSPTSTAWAAQAILAFLARGGAPGVYHAVNTGAVSWFEFARAIVAKAGVAAEVSPVSASEWPSKARRPAYSALDNARLAGVIGPIPGWAEALDAYLAAKGHV